MRQEGRRHFGAAFVFFVRRRPEGGDPRLDLPRFAAAVSRRVGSAVVRNRVKRRLREIFRKHQGLFPGDVDILVSARPRAAGASYAELERQFLAAARRLGFGRGASGRGPAEAGGGSRAGAEKESRGDGRG